MDYRECGSGVEVEVAEDSEVARVDEALLARRPTSGHRQDAASVEAHGTVRTFEAVGEVLRELPLEREAVTPPVTTRRSLPILSTKIQ